eukprot:1632427-Rhodomonas_salina.1
MYSDLKEWQQYTPKSNTRNQIPDGGESGLENLTDRDSETGRECCGCIGKGWKTDGGHFKKGGGGDSCLESTRRKIKSASAVLSVRPA